MTSLKINRLLPMATINMHMKFEIEIPKQTWLLLRKPCRLQTDGRTDGQGESSIPLSNFVGRGYKDTNVLRMYLLNCCFWLNKNDYLWQLWVHYQWRAQYVEEPEIMIIEMWHLILIYVRQHRLLIFIINCSYICFTYFTWIITWAIDDW